MPRRANFFGTFLILALLPVPIHAHPCLCDGDANRDGVFDEQDYAFVIECIGQLPEGACVDADINCDGAIDLRDVDPDDPFSGQSAMVCIADENPPELCCPGHAICGSAMSGDCYGEHAGAACNDADCCYIVCLEDPFCCDFLWDQVCAEQAGLDCMTAGDCDDDGDVDLEDFIVLVMCIDLDLGGILPPECECADIDGDRDTDLIDFGALQAAHTGPH